VLAASIVQLLYTSYCKFFFLPNTRLCNYSRNCTVPRDVFGDYICGIARANHAQAKGHDGSAEANEEGCDRPTRYIKREYRLYFSSEPLKRTRQYEYPTVQRRIYVSVRWNVRDKWKIIRPCVHARKVLICAGGVLPPAIVINRY